jgi:hypothetical protein
MPGVGTRLGVSLRPAGTRASPYGDFLFTDEIVRLPYGMRILLLVLDTRWLLSVPLHSRVDGDSLVMSSASCWFGFAVFGK